ncbi:ABC transporter permease [Kribbella sp. NPDC058245]|uniref:ABC transporter permease n=1 Tax=Kribbella sp. NPDC058245 TaxID=3346399 RepID=UPI0036EB43C8
MSAVEGDQVPVSETMTIKRRDTFTVRLRYILRRDRLGQAALVFVVIVVLAAVFGPLLMGDASTRAELGKRFVAPFHPGQGAAYVLGSDALGRSFLARLLVAARTTLIIAVIAVLAATIVGSLIGTVVGYIGGRVDAYVMRIADVMQAFPSLLLALIILYTVGPGLVPLICVLAVARLEVYVRVARAQTLAVRERLFVTAARALGAGSVRIVLRQIVPVIAPTLVGLATLEFALVILSESALSFLGLGVQQPDVTWGGLIAEGRNYLRDAWWVALLPGLAITLTAVAVNVLADVVRRTTQSD